VRPGAKPTKAKAVRDLEKRLAAALEQQAATSEILRAISKSPTDLQPVLDTIAANAARACGAHDATVLMREGEFVRRVAHHGPITNERSPLRPIGHRGFTSNRAILDRHPVHVHDILAATELDFPDLKESAQQSGYRSILSVPLLRENEAIGALTIRRREVQPFTDRQIALLQTFADQAVIAIENVRLFNETREALEQQTATSDVLRVISSSPTTLGPVYETILDSITRLCSSNIAVLFLREGEVLVAAASHGTTAEFADHLKRSRPRPSRETTTRLAALERRVVHVDDLLADPSFSPSPVDLYRRENVRTVLSVPMLREGTLVGVITTWRRERRPFSEKQIALVRTFADQAVIALENVRLFRELEEKSHQLEIASRHKSEFLANMSHELRTPLNAIIGFSEALTERMFGDLTDKQAEYLRDIAASGHHLLSLINDILDLSKVEAGRMELELADFDLPHALLNALTLVRDRAARRGIALHQAVDERLGAIRGDERKIKQVLLNLLSNALKFTPEGGRVEVRASAADGVAEISVTDTGIGIAPEDHQAVFEEFRQVGTAARKVEGTGLGLALSRKFVELHGGRIWVQSQLGTGSTFTFTLPLTTGS
jgi:signal transduction histidine kinase